MVKKAETADANKIAGLAVLMWNTSTVQELTQEFEANRIICFTKKL